MILVILSAGRGSRLKSLTINQPKCLVKVKKKSIIDYMDPFIKKFEKVIIVTGYKSQLIENKFKKIKNIHIIKNKEYLKTNMVFSLFKIKKKNIGYNDIVVTYSDIIFDSKIYLYFKKKKTFIPVNKNWKKFWSKRMGRGKIKDDAENLEISNNYIRSIGNKIKKKIPKYQFMGLIKILNEDFYKLKKYFKLKKNNIDFTSFINDAIKQKIIKVHYTITSKYWFEIDSKKDIKIVEKLINKSIYFK